jgi:hypothetical protein
MSAHPPRQLLMRVSFDADQLGNQLVWSVTDDVPSDRNAFKRTGPYAGSLHFQQGDVMSVEVVATGRPASFTGFTVTDATLITMPVPYQKRSVTPSPFDETHATFDLDGFGPNQCTISATNPDLRSCVATCAQTLTVVQPKGYWKFSLVLTVIVHRPGSNDPARAFSFDPIIVIGPDD